LTIKVNIFLDWRKKVKSNKTLLAELNNKLEKEYNEFI